MYEFHLEPVLKYRGNVEKSHIQEMIELTSSLREEERILSGSAREAREVSQCLAKLEKKGASSRDILIQRFFLDNAAARISVQKKKIVSVKDMIEKKRLELTKASMDKKVMEKLKEKYRKSFFLELKKKEQKVMDDIALKMSLKGRVGCSL